MSNNNIEFIAAKDLPMTEAEEVNVLCVENGELKLKNASNLGGGKDEEETEPVPEWDAVIDFVANQIDENTSIELISGDFETVKTKIMNKQYVKVLMCGQMIGSDMTSYATLNASVAYNRNMNSEELLSIYDNSSGISMTWLPDNSIHLD